MAERGPRGAVGWRARGAAAPTRSAGVPAHGPAVLVSHRVSGRVCAVRAAPGALPAARVRGRGVGRGADVAEAERVRVFVVIQRNKKKSGEIAFEAGEDTITVTYDGDEVVASRPRAAEPERVSGEVIILILFYEKKKYKNIIS